MHPVCATIALTHNRSLPAVPSLKNVVSYAFNSSKRTLATFVSRKTGMKLRIYPEHIGEYQSFLNTLPEKVKKEIKKAIGGVSIIPANFCIVPLADASCHILGTTIKLFSISLSSGADTPIMRNASFVSIL